MPNDPKTAIEATEYRGDAADAKAAAIEATLGTESESLIDTVWLLRYTTAKHDIRFSTQAEMMEERNGQ
jgi:hypothetical protein